MLLIIADDEARSFLAMLQELCRKINDVGVPPLDRLRFIDAIALIGKSAERHRGGFFSFTANPNYLFDIKSILMKNGFVNSSIRRSALVRIDESLGLYYQELRALRSKKH